MQLAYNIPETPLLKQVRQDSNKGWIAVDGSKVFPEQGIPQFELFTGRKAPRELMRRVVLQSEKRKSTNDS